MVALALLGASHASAQVVEERASEANPASAIFRATLYGAGTGLAIGGAYALIADGDDPSTGEILRWGTALGAGAGVVVGLLYVATRSEPEGSVDRIGMLEVDHGKLSVSPLGLLSVEARRTPPGVSRGLDLSLVGVRF
jgi:hypothetical protein